MDAVGAVIHASFTSDRVLRSASWEIPKTAEQRPIWSHHVVENPSSCWRTIGAQQPQALVNRPHACDRATFR